MPQMIRRRTRTGWRNEFCVRLLIVDDSDFARSQIRALLHEGAPECERSVSAGTDDALAICAQSDPFDLSLLDVYPPRIGGFDLAQLLRIKQDNAIFVCCQDPGRD